MNRFLIVKQDGFKECGAACLLSIIRYYGGNVSINKLLELTNTTKDGTTFYDIKRAALEIGLESKAFKIDDDKKDKLFELKMPSICQVINNGYEHFVVVYKFKKNKVLIMDPGVGFLSISKEEFYKIWTGYVMIFSKGRKLPFIKENKYIQRIVIDTILKNKGIVLNIIILSVIYTIVSCLFAMYSGIVIDNIITYKKNLLIIVTLFFGILVFFKIFSSFLRNKLLIYLNQKLDCSMFLNAFYKILLLPYSYYKNRTTGEIITRINDLTYVKNLLNKIILTVFLDLIVSFGCSIVLIYISVRAFILLIITILIYFLIFYVFKKIQKKYIDLNQKNNAKINSLMVELINGFETIKNLNMESKMSDLMDNMYTNGLNDAFVLDNINNYELLIKDIVTYVSLLLVEFCLFSSSGIKVGKIVIFITLMDYFILPIRSIIDLNKDYFYALNSIKRANNLFDIKSDNLIIDSNFKLDGYINIKNLNYSYNDHEKILKNIYLKVEKGDKILILGESGVGKSTLIKILSKYYVVKRDMIYFNEYDINDISCKNLKDYVITLSRDDIIFTDTIRNNIIVNRKIDSSDFDKVCKITYVDEIVKDMFLGYDTLLEENGQNISGGERQRIILARAFLKNANIILIDEGFSAIDINLERKILKNIFKEYINKTIIIVSHRLENMDLFNKVFELHSGKISKKIVKPRVL